MRQLIAIVALSLGAASAPAAQAATVEIQIQDINDGAGYYNFNTASAQFAGTGFVGMYKRETSNVRRDAFAHILGLEKGDLTRTALQADIGFLSGATVQSATLSFDVANGKGTQDLRVATFDADGTLGYTWSPTVIDSQISQMTKGSNSIDITDLVQRRADAGEDWLGIHLQGTSKSFWTYTLSPLSPHTGFNPDGANVRLNIEYTLRPPSAVPLPAAAPAGMVLMVLTVINRRRLAAVK